MFFNRNFVQRMKFHARAPSSIILWHQNNRSTTRQGRWSDDPFIEQLLDFRLNFCTFHQ